MHTAVKRLRMSKSKIKMAEAACFSNHKNIKSTGFDKTLTPGQLTPYWSPTDPPTDPL